MIKETRVCIFYSIHARTADRPIVRLITSQVQWSTALVNISLIFAERCALCRAQCTMYTTWLGIYWCVNVYHMLASRRELLPNIKALHIGILFILHILRMVGARYHTS